MKLLLVVCLLTMTLGLIPCPRVCAAAATTDSLQFDLDKDLVDQLLPLEQLYQLALQNSPVIREQKALLDVQVEANRLVRSSLLSGVNVSGGYSTGNQSLLATGGNAANAENIQVSNGYRAGVQASISLGTLLGYRARSRQEQAAYRSAVAKQDGIKLGLRREISQLYQTMQTNQKIVNAYIELEQKSLIAYQTAEIEWRKGRLNVDDYAGASTRYTETHIKTEIARGNLVNNLYELSALVGVDMGQLKAR
ncbi:outer membrane protein TolC [Spirosoma lacussanchae]|uniref:TolC family protein n=1 Tax=Spirosoma lacussanchae TaxID=1884249 RepID=UPI001107CE76|nr:TolC family protein [Spirosoma lacussanchae]